MTLTGSNFSVDAFGNPPTVLFGSAPAVSVVVVSPTTITCVTPANPAGINDVSVTNFHGQTATLASAFIYTATVISSIVPNKGPFSGGTTVVITGANIDSTVSVTFGGVAATSIVWIDAQHVSCVTPAHATGPVDVAVNDALVRGGFFYTLLTGQDALRRQPSVQIHEIINQPASCTFTVDGESAPPTAGEEFKFFDDSNNLMFAGVVQTVEMDLETDFDTNIIGNNPSMISWQVTCSDYTPWLNRRRPVGTYTNISATDMILDMVSRFAPWVTTHHLQVLLPDVTFTLDGTQDFASVLTNIAQQVGNCYWRLDYEKDLHFFQLILNSGQVPTPVTGVGSGGSNPTVITAAQGATPCQQYQDGYYAFTTTFVYSNGIESAPGPWCVPITLDGLHFPTLTNIPIGASVGGLAVSARRIYYKWFGRAAGNAMAPFAEVFDNTTTTITTVIPLINGTFGFQPPVLPIVNPPAGPATPPGVSQSPVDALMAFSAVFPSASGLTSYSFTPGTYAFIVTHVYDDGTESLPSPPSPNVECDGLHAIRIDQGNVSETLNGHSVIYTRVYASKAAVDGNTPTFSPATTALWWIVPGVVERLTDITPGMKDRQAVASVNTFLNITQVTSLPSSFLAPTSLEEDPPDDLVDGSTTLLHDPPISRVIDTSQVRNRVIVMGLGQSQQSATGSTPTSPTSSASNAFYAASAGIASSIVTPSGSVIQAPPNGFPLNNRWLQIFNSTPAALGTGLPIVEALATFGLTPEYIQANPFTVFMDLAPGAVPASATVIPPSTSSTSTTTDITRPTFQVDDESSQRYMGSIELDSNGNPTDGVHEVYINTSFDTADECIAFAQAQLKQFAWPIITVKYATRDPKSHPGKMVHVNLSTPPIFGDFLITDVQIDQIKDEADSTIILEPRRTVTAADPSKFNLDDLLLKIGDFLDTNQLTSGVSAAPPNLAAGMNIATAGARAYTNSQIAALPPIPPSFGTMYQLSISAAEMNVLNTTPLVIVPSPGAGMVAIPLAWVFEQNVITTFSNLGNISLQYQGVGTAIGTSATPSNANGRYLLDILQIGGVTNPGSLAAVSNLPIEVISSAGSTGGTGSFLVTVWVVVFPSFK